MADSFIPPLQLRRRTIYHPELQEFLFTWKIENINLRVGKNGIPLDSPSFSLESIPATKMFLRLIPRSDRNELMNVYLHRAKDRGPRRVALAYKFQLTDDCFDGDTNSITTKRVNRVFPEGTYRLSPEDIDHPRPLRWNRILHEPDGELTIRCHILPLGGPYPSFIDPEDPNILQLSVDLSVLFESGMCSDLVLLADKERFKVHKTILCARSSTFAQELEEYSSEEGPIELRSELSATVLKHLLKYLYSGKLTEEVPDLASGLYSAAVKYQVNDLKWKLNTFPKQAFISTKINTEVKTISWSIRDFRDLETTVKVYGPTISMDGVVACDLQPILYISANMSIPIGDQTIPNVIILVRRVGAEISKRLSLYCKFSVIDVGRRLDICRGDYNLYHDDDDWIFPPFFSSYKLLANRRTYLPNNTLSLLCEFIVSDGQCTFDSQDTVVERSLQHPEDLRTFVKDMRDIYLSKKFSDVNVCAADGNIPSHKAILSARSPSLRNVCEKNKHLKEISLLTNKMILEKLLLFIYTGEYPGLENYKDAMTLYVFADQMKVQKVKDYCSETLMAGLSVGNVHEILRFAEEHKETRMTAWLKEFMVEHAEQLSSVSGLELLLEFNKRRTQHTTCTIL